MMKICIIIQHVVSLVPEVAFFLRMFSALSLYSGTWELGTPKGLSETVLNSEVVLFLRSISM